MRRLLLLGLSHRTAPVTLREQLAIPSYKLAEALRSLRASVGDGEAVVLSTCNRVELYVTSEDPATTVPDLLGFLSYSSHLTPETLTPSLYCGADRDAVAHLFRVTAGLDSMVLGESEVTAQVKQAYAVALSQGATGPLLNRVFQRALHCAKVIRSRTRIADGQTSIGSVVLAVTKRFFGERLKTCETLLWGTGEAAEAVARHLIKGGIRQLWIVSRTPAKAQDLAAICQGGWLAWEQAITRLAHVDIAIVCTQAPHYVIDEADMASILPQRNQRPLLLVDLAVPRNVDPALRWMPGIRLCDMDDLQGIVLANMAARGQEVARCGTIIREQVDHLWGRGMGSDPSESVTDLPVSLPNYAG